MAITQIRGNTQIMDGTVTEAKLASDSVTTAKILDANVTEAKIATDAVTTAKIADGAVTSDKIADGTIVDADINAAAAISTSKLADGDEFLQRDGSVVLTSNWDLSAGSFTILVPDPTAPQQVATKAYVDATATGLDLKASVRVATTVAGTLASDFEDGDTIDGVVLATGDRILLKNQADETENGIYVVQATGAPVRSFDADNSPENEVSGGMFTFIEEGTVNGDTGWILVNNGDVVLGTDPLTFTQFSGAGSLTGINLGGGAGVFKARNGTQLEFRTLVSSTTQLDFSQGENTLDITLASNSVTSAELADNAVDAGAIQSDAVTTAKILDANVTEAKLATDAVTTAKIVDGAVTSAKIADGTIVDADINASAAIGRSKIASGTANHVVINDGSGVLSSEAQLGLSRGGTNSDLAGASGQRLIISNAGGTALVEHLSLTANRVLVSDGTSTLPVASTITTNEFETALGGYEVAEGSIESRLDSLESSSGASSYITREVPSGTINSTNADFVLDNTPVAGQESVFLNGILQNVGAGNDYTISSATITFASAPVSGDVILVNYFY